MKKFAFVILLLVIVGIAAYFVLLSKPEIVLTGNKVTEYIDNFNRNNSDFKISLRKEDIKITKHGKGVAPEFLVTLKNAELKYTLKSLARLIKIPDIDYDELPDIDIIEKAEETNLIINPVKKFVGYKSLKNLEINLVDKKEYIDFKGNIELIKSNNFDISPLFFSDKKDVKSIYIDVLVRNPEYNIFVKNFTGEIKDNKLNNGNIKTISFKIKDINLDYKIAESLLKAAYGKDLNINFTELLKKRINSTNFILRNFELSALDKNNKEKGKLLLESAKLNSTVDPSSKNNAIDLDFNYILENCKFKGFDKTKEMLEAEAILNFNKIAINLNIKFLSDLGIKYVFVLSTSAYTNY
jgi:hypothetical protein